VLAFYCCMINCYNLGGLKPHPFIISGLLCVTSLRMAWLGAFSLGPQKAVI
jgi:hypothetical protein